MPWSKVLLVGAVVVAGAGVVDALRPDPPDGSVSAPLRPAPGGDGDSWTDAGGREYRLGLVNAPEQDECFGPEATDERRRLTADGFGATVYGTDRYGRGLSVVTLPDGRNLNVHLARQGFADDRYLRHFRAENDRLAAELEPAFAEAKRERRGLWGACTR
jgi:endonuclease YncB( thermonuclease family)